MHVLDFQPIMTICVLHCEVQSNETGFLMGFDSAELIRFIFSFFFETATNQKYFQSVMNINDESADTIIDLFRVPYALLSNLSIQTMLQTKCAHTF